MSFFSHINIVDKLISQTSIVEKIIVILAQKQWLHMYCMRNHLVKYFEDNFPFFSSFITFFFLPLLLLPHGVALNLSKMISFSTIKKTISLFSPMTNLTFLSLSPVNSLFSYPPVTTTDFSPLSLPSPPTSTPFNQFEVYSPSPLLICYFTWLIYEFSRIRVLGFRLGFLFILLN